MNEIATTTGGYEGATTMQNYLSTKEAELAAVCGSHLLSRRCLTTNSVGTDGKSDNWTWNTHKITLMSETEIYGAPQFGNVFDTGLGYEKLPIFNYLSPIQVFGRMDVWLRGINNATHFCYSNFQGNPGHRTAVDSIITCAIFCIG